MSSIKTIPKPEEIFLSYDSRRNSNSLGKHDLGFRALNSILTNPERSLVHSLRKVSEMASSLLDVDRVSIWGYRSPDESIFCEDLYIRGHCRHESGLVLMKRDYPNYFKVLSEKKFIAVNDVYNHADTSELTGYLSDHNIKSILDAKIIVGKSMGGVVCFEQLEVREWTSSDQMFANAVGDTIALLWEAQKMKDQENQLLKRDEELQLRNDELDQFIYTLSHDIRAPLTSVMGLIGLMRHERPNESVNKYLDLQELSLKRLDDFIISTSSMLKSNGKGVQLEPLRINVLMSKSLQMIELIPNRDLIDINLTTSQAVDFYTDERKLMAIVQNLVIKAIQYADSTKESKHLNISASSDQFFCTIRFEDNGHGWRPEKLKQVEEIFESKNGSPKSLGLGLSIVKHQLDSLNGTIQFKSIQNKGTSIVVKIPNLIV